MIYLYKHPKTGETKEISQGIHDEHIYFEDGVKWSRVFTAPQAMTDTKIDPFSTQDFLKKTDKGGTIGDIWDRSAELSQKREEKLGHEDPLKRKTFENYSKNRLGKKHEHDK